MGHIRYIDGGEIVNMITVCSKKDGRMCYKIRLQLTGGESYQFAEYTRFDSYKKDWRQLQEARKASLEFLVQRG